MLGELRLRGVHGKREMGSETTKQTGCGAQLKRNNEGSTRHAMQVLKVFEAL